MLPFDPNGKIGPKNALPDHVVILEPKDEDIPPAPYSVAKGDDIKPVTEAFRFIEI